MGLKRTNISLDDTQLERRRAKSANDHVPVSESVRRAIDSYLAWNNPTYHPKPPVPRKGRAIHPRHEWTGLSGSFSVIRIRCQAPDRSAPENISLQFSHISGILSEMRTCTPHA
jgi:hypothetical protein